MPRSARKRKLEIDNVTSFLNAVFSGERASYVRCYRGQSNFGWELKPSVMRLNGHEAENRIFSELMVEAPSEFRNDHLMFDKLVRAQHYGLPTRLLDVTLNPLVGLYFACNEEEHHDEDGVVQTFDFDENRVKFPDSDTVSLICNLARLSDEEKSIIAQEFKSVESWDYDQKNRFRHLRPVKRLSQFVRVEKPYFLDAVNPRDLFRYFFVHPAKNNRRVIAQSGAFIAAGLLQYLSLARGSIGFTKTESVIPGTAKAQILAELDVLNINSRTMFPEIEFAAKYIKKKWTG
ncbi:FRG domain-containing protein [Hoeflea marina]|uniref:FRG domain-containing protein n=1 Tax=Hoeflea marina TaxID=274592 RepID=A0A317PJP2_9HYPH|nr:FRG domain-containing protein [Hoeflea marina]PWV99854.1 FRG domain-containing protein [Hoeflea marina]